MKKLTLLLLLLWSTQLLFSQRRESNQLQSENGFYMGFNATNLLKNILSFNGSELDDPYTLVGIFEKNGNGIRIGLGVNLETLKSENRFFADNSNSKLDARIGYQRRKGLWKKLSIMYGFDVLGGYEKDYSVAQNFVNNDNIWNVGGGPVLGLFYSVNNRLSLSTESSLYYKYIVRNAKLESDGLVLEENISQTYKLHHILPNALYVYFKF